MSIGRILSSYTASSLLSYVQSPKYLNSSSAYRSGSAMYDTDFATIASDYKALQTKKYDTLSSSYSYLKDVTSTDYAAESQTSTEKAEESTSDKQIKLSANQMASVYGGLATESHLLNLLV